MNISVLLGKTLTNIVGGVGAESVVFTTSDGEKYKIFHEQNYCESVAVEDVCGNYNDLLDSPLLVAEESSSENVTPPGVPPKELGDTEGGYTWTFYRFATIKGWVVIRWYGESNGYYSESVDFERVVE